ncbi:MAG TPA: hypothetical protein VKZ56_11105 [Membranihabitans sp.]|nr:hypothetical protein [Membranihabitans sp.]
MYKILKYSISDLLRSRWSYVYFLFYLVLGFVMLFLNHDLSKGVITMMNVIVVLVPLIGTIFGVMYYYNSREFTELLLAQPIRRSTIFLGQFLGVALSLTMCLVLGLGIPYLAYGLSRSDAIWDFAMLILIGALLTFIFTALAFNMAIANENRIKGFGYAILTWLFMAVIYDGLFLMALIAFEQYPLDNFSLVATVFNPIDLSRLIILLKLDISALLGYTGAVFKQFFGTQLGLITSVITLILWSILPVVSFVRMGGRKDF